MKTMKLALFLVMAFVLIGTNDASAKRREQQTSIFAYTCDRFTGIQNQPNTRRGVDIYYEDPEGGYSWGADGDWFAWGGGEVRWGKDLDYIDFNYYDGSTLDWDDDWCNDILDDTNPYYVDCRQNPHKKSKPSKY